MQDRNGSFVSDLAINDFDVQEEGRAQQIQQFYLSQATGFVSGLNVGQQTSQGVEFEFDKGDFARPGLAARLTFAYTNSYINYTALSNGP